jgi:hypothetical protein
MRGVFAEDPAFTRIAAGDRTVTRAEYEAARRRQRVEQRELEQIGVAADIIAPHGEPEGPPQPRTADEIEAARHVEAKRRQAIDRQTLDHFRAKNPTRAAELDRLLTLDHDGVMGVIRADNERLEKRMLGELVRRLYAQGLDHDAVRDHYLALRGLLGGDTGVRAAARRAEQIEAFSAQFTDAGRAFQAHLETSPKAAATRALVAGNSAELTNLQNTLRGYLHDEPTLRALAGANPELVGWRFGRYIDNTPPPAKRSAADFLASYRAYEDANLRAAVGEPSSAHLLADRLGMSVLQGGPAGARYNDSAGHGANEHGIDIVGFRPVADAPAAGAPPGTPYTRKVEVILGDDKSHDVSSVGSVSALTENLTQNLHEQATQQRAAIEAQRRAGLAVSSDHETAVRQMEQAAAALQVLDAKTAGGSKANYTDAAYQAQVRAILDAANIRLVITSTLGRVGAVNSALAGYRFEVIR